MIPMRPNANSAPLPNARRRRGGERQDVHLGVELRLGGVPHLARFRTGEGARLGDEGVVLGVGDGGEVDPVGRLGAGHERHRQARHVEVEGGEEHVPCPRLEGDRVELGLVDTLQLHVDAELLPCRHGQFHRQRRVLDLDDVEGADRQWRTVLLAHSVRAHHPAGLVEQLPGRFEVGTGREERSDGVARAGLRAAFGEPGGQRTVASRLHAHQLLQVERTHQRLAHGDVGGRQALHLVEEELTDDRPGSP